MLCSIALPSKSCAALIGQSNFGSVEVQCVIVSHEEVPCELKLSCTSKTAESRVKIWY